MYTELEPRVERFETVLGEFIVQTNMSLTRLERIMEEGSKRTEEDRKEMNKKWRELANKMGTIVEDIVAPNIPGLAKRLFGCEDIEFHGVRVTKRHSIDRSKKREFDVIAACDTKVIVNDTKATPRRNYIDDLIAFVKSREFYAYFPGYKGRELIPMFASLYLTEGTVKYLTKHRIYAMVMKDGAMDIVNFELDEEPCSKLQGIEEKQEYANLRHSRSCPRFVGDRSGIFLLSDSGQAGMTEDNLAMWVYL